MMMMMDTMLQRERERQRHTAVDLVAVVSAVVSPVTLLRRLNAPTIVTVELPRLTFYTCHTLLKNWFHVRLYRKATEL